MMPTDRPTTSLADPDVCYRALQGRDARFDGSFFVGVTSTGIYCRPVCRVKCPQFGNCRFFGHAALAEKAGFRPCLRCRPELAPHALPWSIQDASATLAQQAARWLDEPLTLGAAAPTVSALAARLGVSARHVRRIFEAQLGVSPLQYLQTRRLLTAKQLLADTDLPVTDVAYASGFASVRRFNEAFVLHYGMPPSALRKTGGVATKNGAAITVRLGYRPPYDVAAMLAFLAKRALATIECIAAPAGVSWVRRTFGIQINGKNHAGWVEISFDEPRCHLVLRVAPSLREVLPLVIHRVRAWLDVDADPGPINALLLGDFPGTAGLRVPGCIDGYELAVRAVLGQQITVAAARTLSQRLLDRFGTPIITPWPELTRLFPAPVVLARAEGDALGALGIVKTRQAAIVAIAQAVDAGHIVLNGSADVAATLTALKALPGIGDWTAQYITMRALRWPDAFPAGDVALHKALHKTLHTGMGVQDKTQSITRVTRACEAASQAWKPWRSYAVIRAWHGLG